MPNATAAQKPAPTPIAGAQSRNAPELRSKIPIMTAKVTEAHTGDAHDDDPGGTSSMMPKRRGSTVMTINIKTVPFTIGVTTRLRRDNQMESAIFDKPETLTNAASVEGPPSTSAMIQIGIPTRLRIGMRMNPEPRGPIRTVCNTVVKPMTAITAKTIHETWESFPPAPLDHDKREQHQRRNAENGVLQHDSQRNCEGRSFVRLVAGVVRGGYGGQLTHYP